jgi:hypothetical protein
MRVSDAQREAIAASTIEALGHERARLALERAERYFDESFPESVQGYMNAVLRESYRLQHGSTKKWDKLAIANGRHRIGKVAFRP